MDTLTCPHCHGSRSDDRAQDICGSCEGTGEARCDGGYPKRCGKPAVAVDLDVPLCHACLTAAGDPCTVPNCGRVVGDCPHPRGYWEVLVKSEAVRWERMR